MPFSSDVRKRSSHTDADESLASSSSPTTLPTQTADRHPNGPRVEFADRLPRIAADVPAVDREGDSDCRSFRADGEHDESSQSHRRRRERWLDVALVEAKGLVVEPEDDTFIEIAVGKHAHRSSHKMAMSRRAIVWNQEFRFSIFDEYSSIVTIIAWGVARFELPPRIYPLGKFALSLGKLMRIQQLVNHEPLERVVPLLTQGPFGSWEHIAGGSHVRIRLTSNGFRKLRQNLLCSPSALVTSEPVQACAPSARASTSTNSHHTRRQSTATRRRSRVGSVSPSADPSQAQAHGRRRRSSVHPSPQNQHNRGRRATRRTSSADPDFSGSRRPGSLAPSWLGVGPQSPGNGGEVAVGDVTHASLLEYRFGLPHTPPTQHQLPPLSSQGDTATPSENVEPVGSLLFEISTQLAPTTLQTSTSQLVGALQTFEGSTGEEVPSPSSPGRVPLAQLTAANQPHAREENEKPEAFMAGNNDSHIADAQSLVDEVRAPLALRVASACIPLSLNHLYPKVHRPVNTQTDATEASQSIEEYEMDEDGRKEEKQSANLAMQIPTHSQEDAGDAVIAVDIQTPQRNSTHVPTQVVDTKVTVPVGSAENPLMPPKHLRPQQVKRPIAVTALEVLPPSSPVINSSSLSLSSSFPPRLSGSATAAALPGMRNQSPNTTSPDLAFSTSVPIATTPQPPPVQQPFAPPPPIALHSPRCTPRSVGNVGTRVGSASIRNEHFVQITSSSIPNPKSSQSQPVVTPNTIKRPAIQLPPSSLSVDTKTITQTPQKTQIRTSAGHRNHLVASLGGLWTAGAETRNPLAPASPTAAAPTSPQSIERSPRGGRVGPSGHQEHIGRWLHSVNEDEIMEIVNSSTYTGPPMNEPASGGEAMLLNLLPSPSDGLLGVGSSGSSLGFKGGRGSTAGIAASTMANDGDATPKLSRAWGAPPPARHIFPILRGGGSR